MARQKGIVKLKGTIGDITFYRSQGSYLAREKGGVDGDRIANDPAFERTRENGAEFGRAGNNGKVLRTSIRSLLLKTADPRMVGRLTKQILRIIKMDPVNVRGQRVVTEGDLQLLNGFEFNVRGKLSTTLYAPFNLNVDRVAGEVTVNIPSMVPANAIAAPVGATHLRIITGAAAVDFPQEEYRSDTNASSDLVIGPQTEAPIALTMNLPPNSTRPIFVVLGIEFYQEVNAVMYPLKNGAYNALAIVSVNLP